VAGEDQAGVVTHQLASSLDLFPTVTALAGIPLPKERIMDGVDMSPILFERGPSKRKVMFYYNGAELFAARKGAYKLHLITYTGYSKEPPKKAGAAVVV